MSWSSRKKKESILCTVYFVRREFFLIICALSLCILYWIHFQNIHTFTYEKTLLHTLLLFVFKIVESLQCILNGKCKANYLNKKFAFWKVYTEYITRLEEIAVDVLENSWRWSKMKICTKAVRIFKSRAHDAN